MKPRKLTDAVVARLSHDNAPYHVRDAAIAGFFVAVNKTCKSYKVQRDLWVGKRGQRRLVKTVRITLGTTDDLTLDVARAMALEAIAKIKRGVDPNARHEGGGSSEGWTVQTMYDQYADDMRARECVPRSIESIHERLNLYLDDWKSKRISDVTRTMAREKHIHITKHRGKRVANQALRDFRAAYNLALRVVDEADALPDNPTKSITWNKERASNRVIMPDDLPEWWRRAEALQNPIRRDMHKIGLLTGLRPGALMSIKRKWVNVDKRCISFPRMKSGRSFDLPLSTPILDLISSVLKAGTTLYPDNEWLFPTRDKDGRVTHVQVIREASLPSETGHILRHTFRTLAKNVGVDQIDARLLLDHRVPGIDGVYIHSEALFKRLLATQEQVSAAILAACIERDRAEVAIERRA